MEYGDLSHIEDKTERAGLLQMEREAQKFAGELLMPSEPFSAFVDMGKTIEDIAKEFAVSEAAASTRAKHLQLIMF